MPWEIAIPTIYGFSGLLRSHFSTNSRFVSAAVSVEVTFPTGVEAVSSAHAPSSSTTPAPAATTPSRGPVSRRSDGHKQT